MEQNNLISLKSQLSDQWKKPKSERNTDLIKKIQSDIQAEKNKLHKEFKKSQQRKKKAEVEDMLRLERKKIKIYKEIRDKKRKEQVKQAKKAQIKKNGQNHQ